MRHPLSRVFLATVVGVAAFCSPAAVFGWLPTQHGPIANLVMNDSSIKPFLTTFGLTQSSIASAAFEPSPAETYQWGCWTNAYNSGRNHNGYMLDPNFVALSETNRIGYMLHNTGDNGVPLNHAPANQIYVDQSSGNPESKLEMFSLFGGTPPTIPSSMPTLYTGTYAQKVSQFYTDQMDLVSRFKVNHSSSDLGWAGAEGIRNALRLSQTVMLDYFRLKTPEVANANGSYAVNNYGTLSLNSSGSYDPDGDAFSSIGWDINNDGTYDVFGANPTISYSELIGTYHLLPGAHTIKLKVVDDNRTDAGVYGENFATATLTLGSNLPGDADNSGTVDATDLNTVLSFYGQTNKSWTGGDFNNDGVTDATDLNTVLSFYNQSSGSLQMASSSTGTVPEPSVFAMLASMAAAGLFWRFGHWR